MALEFAELEQLQSANYSHLLDVIDDLRAQGLSQFFPLPQLIVCGDQSSGKSSVLEAVSGVPFPKKDQLCTRFATEVILRRNDALDDVHASVSINPGSTRSSVDREHLLGFQQEISAMEDLPGIIALAKDAMGLGSMGHAFSSDVLRLEVTGPYIPQLTIVDLPGLIHSENKMQTAHDVELVTALVESYMKQERSIILAVVSAKNDYANQIILKKARTLDPDGTRTLGIITKPDTLYPGSDSEAAYLELAKNRDIKFSLGWHVLRNPDSNQADDVDKGRVALEAEFFARPRWNLLPPDARGIETLRERLRQILFAQIKDELPSLIRDIEDGVDQCTRSLHKLGRSRETEQEQRHFVSDIAQDFYDICRAACDGTYDIAFFAQGPESEILAKCLRAAVRNATMDFAKTMFESGSSCPLPMAIDDSKQSNAAYDDALSRATGLVKRRRGRELPGMFNPLIVGDLFRQYASTWSQHATDHVHAVWRMVRLFVDAVLQDIADADVRDACQRLVFDPQLDDLLAEALVSMQRIISEIHSPPVTYNDEFLRAYHHRKHTRQSLRINEHWPRDAGSVFDSKSSVPAVVRILGEETKDMDALAARDVIDYMVAYYEVALKRFVDNVPAQVLEPIFMKQLPAMFTVQTAWRMEAAQVAEIAGESIAKQQTRLQLTERLKIFRTCEAVCRRYSPRLMDLSAAREYIRPTPPSSRAASCHGQEEDRSISAAGEPPVPEARPDDPGNSFEWGFSLSHARTKKDKKKLRRQAYAFEEEKE